MRSKWIAARRTVRPAVVAWAFLLPMLAGSTGRAQMGISLKPLREQAAERRIRAGLEETISLELDQMPLSAVADRFAEQLGVNCLLDQRALDEPGVTADTLVTFKARAIGCGSALTQLLRSVDESLTWMIADNAVMITTKTKAESAENFELRIYPVRDLVNVQVDGQIEADYDTLIDVITSAIAPDTWGDAPGQGAIKCFDNTQVLIVSHTPNVQIAVARLLKALRSTRGGQTGDVSLPRSFDLDDDRPASRTAAAHDVGPQPAWRLPQVYR